MKELDVSGMNNEQRINCAAEELAKMPVGKAAVFVLADDGGAYVRIIQRSQDPAFTVMDFYLKEAEQLHALLGHALSRDNRNN